MEYLSQIEIIDPFRDGFKNHLRLYKLSRLKLIRYSIKYEFVVTEYVTEVG